MVAQTSQVSSARGRSSRRKGASFERALTKLLTASSGVPWERARGGERQPFGDVVPSAPLPTTWPRVYIEAKNVATVGFDHLIRPTRQILAWWESALERATAVELLPVLFLRIRHRATIVILLRETASGIDADFASLGWIVTLDPDLWGEDVVALDAETLLLGRFAKR